VTDDPASGAGTLSAFSDDALALRYADKAHAERRYVAQWNKWFHWTGTHWAEDKTLKTFDEARHLCREKARGANDGAKGIASARTIAAVVSLARVDHRLAATVEQWDVSPWLLNTPAGTIALRTGDLREHRTTDYITKVTAVAPAAGDCPKWRTFLDQIFDGDVQLVGFVQRMLGYCLTGATSEHALFFCYGLGANGKSTLVSTVAGILGEYHRVAPMAMLLASKHERHETELAGLVGRRLVTASETEGGKRWAEAKLKSLTGGESISARFMCRDYFDYIRASSSSFPVTTSRASTRLMRPCAGGFTSYRSMSPYPSRHETLTYRRS
jgi:putative DNA primase/helicase